jgi:hypothetical protein
MSWRRWLDYYGDRVQYHIGDVTNEDDPRGREIGIQFEFGVATGQFAHVGWDGKTYPMPEYGSWGFWAVFWHWGVSLTIRGPVLGHYPPEEDE